MTKKRKSANLSAGDGTPYWYEWYVGLKYVIELISPNSDIKSVTFQSSESQKLDDVVILYKNEVKECIQVKNTREDNKLGFEAFIKDYLPQFAQEWRDLKTKHGKSVHVQLYSNKSASGKWYGNKNTEIYKRPQLDKFWEYIQEASKEAKSIADIEMRETDNWEKAWEKCIHSLDGLINSEEDLRLEFIKSFDIRLGQGNLFPLEDEIITLISCKYNIDINQSRKVFDSLVAELPKWTTKDGKRNNSEEVTHESVIKALFIRGNEKYSEHNIPVIADFFESRKGFANDLTKGLKETHKKAVFLTGEPNAGKTTIVSYMYNGYANIIDFRFYAFRPLVPGSPYIGADKGNSSHRGLWGDLFIQVFDFICNKFNDYSRFKIIPYIDWMDDIKLQTETLRILGELANELKRKIIVAIDGIDHAARSKDGDNFLRKFCGPESIPEDVCFLIAGQPINAYIDEYPAWFKNQDYVDYYEVPKIIREDISQLYEASIINKTCFDKGLVIDLIQKISQGNTLSAVLAIREAESCLNIKELEEKLIIRKLNDGVDHYYEAIWSHCIGNINVPVKESIEIKLACILSFSISKITSDILSGMFSELSFSEEDWKFILRKLAPLICEYDDGFVIDINDVRVFLKKKINSIYNKEAVSNVKVALSKYYLKAIKYIAERHEVVYELLKDTNCGCILAENFNVEFMMEALIIKQPLNDIRKQLEFTIKSAITVQRWDLIVNVFCAIRTFEQFEKTMTWNDETYKENKRPRYLYKSEILNSVEIEYTATVLTEIIKDALNLYRLNEITRSKAVIVNHFKSIDITYIAKLFIGNGNTNLLLNDSKQRLIADFGRICRYCEFPLKVNKDILNLDENEYSFLELYLKGWFEASTDFGNIDIEKTVPENFIIPTGEVFFRFLEALAKENYWSYLFNLIDSIFIENFNKPIILQIGAWYIQHCRFEQLKTIQDIIAKKNFEYLRDVKWETEYPTEYKLKAYCNLFFILGYNKDECLNIDNVLDEFYIPLEHSEKTLLRFILKTNYKIGYYFNVDSDRKSFEPEYKLLLETLLNWKNRYTNHISISEFIKDILLKTISLGEAYEDNKFQGITFEIFKNMVISFNHDGLWDYSLSPILIPFLHDRGERKTLVAYLRNVSSTEGQLWRLSVDERRYIIKDIFKCCKNISMDNQYLNLIKEWDQWFSVGYSGHKEYILFDLLEWLTLLFKHDFQKWKLYFSRVMEITKIVNKFADNRIGIEFDVLFSRAAVKESISCVGDILNSRNISKKDKIYVLSGLFKELLEDGSIELEDTVVLWCFLYENLYGDSYTDKEEISNLKEYIIDYFKENNYPNEMLDRYLHIDEVKDYHVYSKTLEKKQKVIPENYQDCIIYIEKLFDSGEIIWEECCSFIKLLKNNRPKNTNEYINRIINLLVKRKNTYEWRGDGVYDVYKAVFPFIDEDAEWILLEKNIENLNNEKSIPRWAYLIGDVLQNICLLHAESSSIEEIEIVVKAIIDMHIRFLSGNYRFIYLRDNILTKSNNVETWADLIKELN